MTQLTRTFETVIIKSKNRNWSEKVKIEMTIEHHTGKIFFTSENEEMVKFGCSLEKAQNIARAINAGLKYAKNSMDSI